MIAENLKVLHLIARFNRGGTAEWLSQLTLGLREVGIHCEIFAGSVSRGEEEDARFVSLAGIKLNRLGRKLSVFDDLITIFEFRRILKAEKPHILNTHTAKAGLVGRVAAIGLGINVVHTYHGHVLYGYFNKFTSKTFQRIEKLLDKITDAFIVNGEKVKTELLNCGISVVGKYNVIYPGINSDGFNSESELRARLNVNAEQIIVGWLGRITKIKRFDRVLDLALAFPDIKFLVGGKGDLGEYFEKLSPPNVIFLGWVNPREFWPACDIALLTSDNEATPIALIEAAYSGLPIVAEDVGSVSEGFENGVGGFLTTNISERINSIRKLSNDKSLRQAMGSSARNYALKKFSVEKFILEHLRVYNQL